MCKRGAWLSFMTYFLAARFVWQNVQGGEMKRNPEMGETAIQPLPAQTADLSISGLRFMSSPCTYDVDKIFDILDPLPFVRISRNLPFYRQKLANPPPPRVMTSFVHGP